MSHFHALPNLSCVQFDGSYSSSSVFAGVSRLSVHRQHLPYSFFLPPGVSCSRPLSPLSLHSGVHCKPCEVNSRSLWGDAPLRRNDQHSRGIFFFFLARLQTIVHTGQELLCLTQASAWCLHPVTGLLVPCPSMVPLCMHVSSLLSVAYPERPL